MKYFFIIIFVLIFSIEAKSQNADKKQNSDSRYKFNYETPDSGIFDGYDDADFKLDYFLSYGISLADRFTYEFVAIDSSIILSFNSPETKNYNLIEFRKKILLSSKEIKELKTIVEKAKLKQLKEGIPLPKTPEYAREIIVVNYKSKQIDITGGITSNLSFDKSMKPEEIKAEIAKEREASASVKGDIDSIREYLEKKFPEIRRLVIEATKAAKEDKKK